MTPREPAPRFAHHSVFGPDQGTRRFTPQRMIALAGACCLLLAVGTGLWQYARTDHGTAVPVQATAIGRVELRQTQGGYNSVCHAIMRVTEPRQQLTQRISVPCGVTPGRPAGPTSTPTAPCR